MVFAGWRYLKKEGDFCVARSSKCVTSVFTQEKLTIESRAVISFTNDINRTLQL